MKRGLKFLVFVSIGAFFLMLDAFYNGFPIVYSDTSTYIASGLELETPFDRPITYGLFLRLFSLNGLSLWFVVFFQAVILSYLIFLTIRLLTDEHSFLKFGLIAIICLSLFTGVSWTVSQLMPDIFTSIALLSGILILFEKTKRKEIIVLYIFFFISVAMNISHILLFTLLLLLTFGLKKIILRKEKFPIRNKLHITILFILIIGAVTTMGSAISKSKHVFFMGAMVEHGIAKQYLHEHCLTESYKLCTYKDSLPSTFNDFVWKDNSPLYKIGGWQGTKEEFTDIIYGSLTESQYLGMHVRESCKASFKQLKHFDIGDGNGSFLNGTPLFERIEKYFPGDLVYYSTSRQSQSSFQFTFYWNLLFRGIIVLSILLLVLLFTVFKFRVSKLHIFIGILIFLSLLLNAWSNGTFSTVADRFGCKMIWLIPFIAIISLLKYLQKNKARFDHKQI